MTPKQALKAYCRRCVDRTSIPKDYCCGSEFIHATKKPCTFHNKYHSKGKVSMKLLRQECLFCMNGNRLAIKECDTYDCPLHEFRLGKSL